MKQCVIITSYIEGNLSRLLEGEHPDLILCADGGYDHAQRAGIVPDFLIGDFDSLAGSVQPGIETITFPAEKDDTDTGLCLQAAMERGCDDILIIGGLGGRFDHALANIQLMAAAADRVARIVMKDSRNYVTILKDGQLRVPRKNNAHLSILSLSDTSLGVCLEGVKYPLSDYTMTRTFPLGVSNEFEENEARISVKKGTLFVALTQD